MPPSELPTDADLEQFRAVVITMRALHVRRWGDIELDAAPAAAPHESEESRMSREARLERDAERRHKIVQFAHSKVRPR